jgi:hypothetical protein
MNVAKGIIQELNLDPEKVVLGQGTLRPDLIVALRLIIIYNGGCGSGLDKVLCFFVFPALNVL